MYRVIVNGVIIEITSSLEVAESTAAMYRSKTDMAWVEYVNPSTNRVSSVEYRADH
jgi:hypothetical protein